MCDAVDSTGVSFHMDGCLRKAVASLDDFSGQCIISYLQSLQNSDGGYRGRDASSDLYYTLFSLILLDAFGVPDRSAQLNTYLKHCAENDALDFIHHVCLLRCLLRVCPEDKLVAALCEKLNSYSSDDGGYAPEKKAAATTAYAPFAAMLALEEAGMISAEFVRVVEAVGNLHTSDGGFSNDTGNALGLSPATAAAIVLQKRFCNAVDDSALTFLRSMSAPKGGFYAVAGAPCADLLSTATVLYALNYAGENLIGLRESNLEFVENLWRENGGFCAYSEDNQTDSEYTFYGMLALGCLLI